MVLFASVALVLHCYSRAFLQGLGIFTVLPYAGPGTADSTLTVWFPVFFGWYLSVNGRNSSLFKEGKRTSTLEPSTFGYAQECTYRLARFPCFNTIAISLGFIVRSKESLKS